jgi:hypothetical protein
MTELFYWKEIERRARAAQALAMLHNRMDTDGIGQANAILDELCLDRKVCIDSRACDVAPRPRRLRASVPLRANAGASVQP